MAWTVATSDESDAWWKALPEDTQEALAIGIGLLQKDGPNVPRPYADKLRNSKIDMRELRRTVHEDGDKCVYRILYSFDPLRQAFLCLGGDKENDREWYKRNIPRAEAIFAAHVKKLEAEQKKGGKNG
jgi:hypothetical protein